MPCVISGMGNFPVAPVPSQRQRCVLTGGGICQNLCGRTCTSSNSLPRYLSAPPGGFASLVQILARMRLTASPTWGRKHEETQEGPVREDRIRNEAIVDANGPQEQVMGWYYLDDKIRFPFQAKCIAPKIVSPLRKGETLEVQRMAPEDACSREMLVLIRWQSRTMAVPLSQLT
jgi:hypothetical protein